MIERKEFVATALNLADEAFIVNVAFFSSDANIRLFYRPQIASLKADEAPTDISSKYVKFIDVFSSNLAAKLPKYTKINNHAIDLIEAKQSPYGSIYSLELVELETLKTHIKTNLVNGFIKLFKSPAVTSIFFDQNPDSSF